MRGEKVIQNNCLYKLLQTRVTLGGKNGNKGTKFFHPVLYRLI